VNKSLALIYNQRGVSYLYDLQSLFDDLGELVDDGSFRNYEICTGGEGGGLNFFSISRNERDNRDMEGGGVLFYLTNGGIDGRAILHKVEENEQRLLPGGRHMQKIRAGHGLDTIIHVLQPVNEAAAGK